MRSNTWTQGAVLFVQQNTMDEALKLPKSYPGISVSPSCFGTVLTWKYNMFLLLRQPGMPLQAVPVHIFSTCRLASLLPPPELPRSGCSFSVVTPDSSKRAAGRDGVVRLRHFMTATRQWRGQSYAVCEGVVYAVVPEDYSRSSAR